MTDLSEEVLAAMRKRRRYRQAHCFYPNNIRNDIVRKRITTFQFRHPLVPLIYIEVRMWLTRPKLADIRRTITELQDTHPNLRTVFAEKPKPQLRLIAG